MSLLTKLKAKKAPATTLTLSFQILPELASKLEEATKKTETPRYDIVRFLLEQGLDALLEEIETTPDSPVPEFDEV